MEHNVNTNNLRKYLTLEVQRIVGVIVFCAWVLAPFYSIKQDVALISKDIEMIKENHMRHVEAFAKDITRMSEEQSSQQKMLIELMKEIASK